MDNIEMIERINAVKTRIEQLIEEGNLDEAKTALNKLNEKMPGDPDVCSMRAIIHIVEGSPEMAEEILLEGLKRDSVQYDLLYNLAYIYEQRGQLKKAADLYGKAGTAVSDDAQRSNITEALKRLKEFDSSISTKDKARIVFFVKQGMDSFLGDITEGLSNDYWVRKIIVTDFKQIDEGMEWADICWFEWCDELIGHGSRLPLAAQKRIICRLHSYEAFTPYINNVVWINVDKVVFIAEHIRSFVLDKQKNLGYGQTVIIPNGVDIDKFTFRERTPGFSVAYVGYINYKKGPMLLLHTFKALYDSDKRYKLHIAGKFQDYRDELYFSHMINEMGIEKNVFYHGWQENINQWLEDKNYILCTSLLESQNLSVMQAMCKGIKPVIHNFVGAGHIYPGQFLWNTIDEAVNMVTSEKYDAEEYHDFVRTKYSLGNQLYSIKILLEELESNKKVLNKLSEIIRGVRQTEELSDEELTILIPNYNRAKMLKSDLDRGLKLGNQPKLIVDDCSTQETEYLDQICGDKKYNANIIRKQINEGLAQSRWTGFQHISTKFTAFVDDDDMLVCIDADLATADIEKLNKDYLLLIPRYLLNLSGDILQPGYDRYCYNDRSAADVLRDIAQASEIKAMLAGGSIGCTEELRKHSFAREFKVAEDFVMLSRLFSANPAMKIGTTESLVHVRRVSDQTLSKTLTSNKLATGLISQCIACYHCLYLGIASQDEVLEWMKDRAALIQKLYDFGEDFETELIAYLTGGINEEVFIHFLALHGFKLYDSLDELAPELRKMRALLYEELQTQENTSAMVEPLPLVSILIPTFNRRDMLKRAVDSVLKQDYGNLEVIVMDNCSEDGTEEMIRSNYRNEKRLVYIRNERNLGPNASVVKGFYHYTTGKYCLLLFDDDYFIYSKYLAECVDFLETHDNVSFVFGDKYHNNLIENKVYRVEAKQPDVVNGLDYFINFKSEKYPIMPSTNTVLFRRDIAVKNEVMGGEANTVIGDLILLVKLSLLGDIGYINRIVVVYTLHNGSMSCNIDNRIAVKNDDGGKKAVATAKDDIVELTKLGKKASDLKRLDRDIIDKWLSNRIFNYLFWRFNETVKSNEECIALLRFVKDNYIDYYVWFRDFASKKYGEELLKELRYNDETCFYNS